MNEMEQKLNKLWADMYGDPETGDIGIKQMVKEMHEIMTWFKGYKAVIILVVMVAGAVGAIKGLFGSWFMK